MSSSIRLTSSGAPDTPPSGYARLYVEEFEGQLFLKMKRPDGSVQVFGTINTPMIIEQGGTGLTDLPQNGQILIGNGTEYVLNTLTAGTNIQITNDAGSITLDVADTNLEVVMPTEFDVAGSPVTNSGIITVTKKPQSPNTVYAGPTVNIENVPSFRLLTQDDIPQLSKYKIIDFDENVQNILAITIENSASIVFEYNDVNNKIQGFLTETGVIPGTYGSTQFIPAIQIDTQGRIINVTEIPASFLSSQISDITEKIEDTIGNLIKETDSIQIEYNDVLSTLELNVKPEYLITTNISESENFKAPTSQAIKIYVDDQIEIEKNLRDQFDSFLQDELVDTQKNIGVGSSVSYSGHPQSNYIKSSDFETAGLLKSLNNADKLLDIALKQVSDTLTTEITRSTSIDELLTQTAESLDNRLDILEGSGEGSVSKAVSDESLLRIAGDNNTLTTANNYTDLKISNLVNSAPEVLNTLKELSDALGSDPNFATTISGQIGTISSNLTTEINRATNSELLLQNTITNLQTEINTLETDLSQEIINRNADVSAEQLRAEAAETILQNNIDDIIVDLQSEITRATNVENNLSTDIAAEETRALTAESGLQSDIDTVEANLEQEVINRISGDTATLLTAQAYTNQAISNLVGTAPEALNTLKEIADAIANDASIAATLTASIASVQGEVDAIEIALASETSARQSADSATLASAQAYADTKVAALVNSAPAVLDTLKELSDALGSDPNFATTVANNISAVAANLASEVTRATNAESGLAADITAEETRALAAESGLQNDIDNVATNLASEITNRGNAITTVQNQIDTEKNRALLAESVLQTNINTVSTNLTTEINTRTTEDTLLKNRLDIIEGNGTGSIAKAEQNAKDYANARLADVLGAVSPDVIESLTNLQNALSDNDVTTGILDGIAAEKLARENKDIDLQNQITSLQTELNTTQLSSGLNTNGTYTAPSSNYLTTTTSLVSALSALDTQIKNAVDYITFEVNNRIVDVNNEETRALNRESELQTEINNTQISIGLNADGSYTAPVSTNYLNISTSIKDALLKLDTAIKTEVDQRIIDVTAEETRAIAAENALQSSIDAITGGSSGSVGSVQTELNVTQTGAGLNSDGTYTAPLVSNYLSNAISLKDADLKLDSQIKIVSDSVTALETQVGADLQSQISSVQTSINNEITARTNDVSTINTRLNTFFANAPLDFDTIVEINNRVSALETTNTSSTTQTQLNALDLRLDTAESDINALEQQDNVISARIDVVESDINAEATTRISEITKINNKINTTTTILQNLIGIEAQTRTDEIDRVYNSIEGFKTTVNLTPSMLTNGVVINTNQIGDIMPNTVVAFIDRLGLFEDLDFYLDNTNGKIELFFLPGILSIIDGTEVLRINYLIKI